MLTMIKTITTIALVFCCSLLSAQNDNTDKNQNYFLYSGIAVILIVAGILIYRFFRNTAEKKSDRVPVIKNVFPNPSPGPVTIQIEGKATQLKLLNMNGQPLGAFAVVGGDAHFDLSSMPRGNYKVIVYYGATPSNAVQFTLK